MVLKRKYENGVQRFTRSFVFQESMENLSVISDNLIANSCRKRERGNNKE
jgi:hypothetical protein